MWLTPLKPLARFANTVSLFFIQISREIGLDALIAELSTGAEGNTNMNLYSDRDDEIP